ncbi:dynamin family protein [soil metagenome]
MHVLDERRKELLGRERSLLDRLIAFLADFGAPQEDTELVKQTLSALEELFLLVVVGEFNSGKSAFINAMLGDDIAAEGVTPTTDRITVLRHNDEPENKERREGILEKGHPNEFLREIAIVDTPGTNAIIRQHEELSRSFVPRSDLVLFITSAERPLTESERGYLELIRDWGKKIVLVVNKSDLLDGDESLEKVRSFVSDGIRSMLGLTPPIFFVSSMMARKAKAASSEMERDALLKASGLGELEEYVAGLLDEEGRIRLKLESPLGVVEELVRRYRKSVGERMTLLEDDFKTAENVESQLNAFQEDMRRDFDARMAEIENIIHSLNERGDSWFEDNIRIGNVAELVRRERIQERFQREVIADTEALIDERVDELVDWMVDRNLKQWRDIVEYVNRRRQAQYDEHLIGEVGDNFEYNRSQVIRSVGKNATDVVRNYDREHESEQIALSLQGAVAQTVAAEVGALGLGTAVATVAMAAAVDVTMTLSALLLAGLGFFIIPNRRRKAREEFREKTDALRARLSEVVTRQFETELARSAERMREAIAPYTRFVRTEHARMTEARSTLAELDGEVDSLKEDISAPSLDPPSSSA